MTDTAPTSKPEETCGKVTQAVNACESVQKLNNGGYYEHWAIETLITAAKEAEELRRKLDAMEQTDKEKQAIIDEQAQEIDALENQVYDKSLEVNSLTEAIEKRPDAETLELRQYRVTLEEAAKDYEKLAKVAKDNGLMSTHRDAAETGAYIWAMLKRFEKLPAPPQPDKEG